LQGAVKKRDALASQIERLKGRLQEAQSNLESVEEQCRSRDIDPAHIDEAVDQLRSKYDTAVAVLETSLTNVQESLGPFEA